MWMQHAAACIMSCMHHACSVVIQIHPAHMLRKLCNATLRQFVSIGAGQDLHLRKRSGLQSPNATDPL